MEHVRGKDLQVGDIIEVWWSNPAQVFPKREMITAIRQYKGRLEYLWKEGATLVSFSVNKTGMTIDNSGLYTRFASWYDAG